VSTIKKTNAKNAMKTINTLVIGLLFSSAVSAQKFPLTVTYAAQNPVCYDESNGLIELFVNGGAAPYTFEWNDGSTAHFKSHIPAGTYDIMVRDAANIAVDRRAKPSLKLAVSSSCEVARFKIIFLSCYFSLICLLLRVIFYHRWMACFGVTSWLLIDFIYILITVTCK
jgi:hypothetical protein